jgi:benzoylformate decarboxylase
MTRSGSHALLSMLAEAGVRHLFGNPGTTELPLVDALLDQPQIRYILGLQEVPVMAMADGYAQATGRPSIVNVHISCGLGNAMGMLYNAYRAGSPVIVTAGQQDRRLRFEEPILSSDMVSVAAPWTKWSAEVQRVEDLPSAVRRALQTAITPPTGPVFLSIPVDVLTDDASALDLRLSAPLDIRVRPPLEALRRAAEALLAARNPAILAGSRVTERGGMAALVRLAERLGAPVIAESGTTHGRVAFPVQHPLCALGLPLWSPDVRRRLEEFDVLLVAGADVLRQYVYYDPPRPLPEHLKLVHLDDEPWQFGKNYPVDVAVWGHVGEGLAELDELLRRQMREEHQAAARQRGAARTEAHRRMREELHHRAEAERNVRPATPLALMSALARALPANAAVVEEAVTTTNTYFERLGALGDPAGYFGHRGWALGWGLGCSIGVKLAWPDRPVLCLLGDGGALYGIQGLWTAAHYRLPVTFVLCNNAQYEILKVGARGMNLPHASAGRFLGMDLKDPEIDYVALARSLGVEAVRVADMEELAERVRTSLAGDRPMLFDVPLTRDLPDGLRYT